MEKNRLRECCYYPFENPVTILLSSLHTTAVTITDAFHAALHFALFIWGDISVGWELNIISVRLAVRK
jgi:hypothetical protein